MIACPALGWLATGEPETDATVGLRLIGLVAGNR